jgi:hypothetical protein
MLDNPRKRDILPDTAHYIGIFTAVAHWTSKERTQPPSLCDEKRHPYAPMDVFSIAYESWFVHDRRFVPRLAPAAVPVHLVALTRKASNARIGAISAYST